MPVHDETTLGEPLTARLCHDLIGPMSAVHNGVDLAEESETAAGSGHIISMVKESAKQALGQLAFFRVAFGSGSGQENWFGKDIEVLLEDALATKRSSFARSVSFAKLDCALSLENARPIFGIAMAAAECLPRGGFVTIFGWRRA